MKVPGEPYVTLAFGQFYCTILQALAPKQYAPTCIQVPYIPTLGESMSQVSVSVDEVESILDSFGPRPAQVGVENLTEKSVTTNTAPIVTKNTALIDENPSIAESDISLDDARGLQSDALTSGSNITDEDVFYSNQESSDENQNLSIDEIPSWLTEEPSTDTSPLTLRNTPNGWRWLAVGIISGIGMFVVNSNGIPTLTPNAQVQAISDPSALVSESLLNAKTWYKDHGTYTGFPALAETNVAAGGPVFIVTAGSGESCTFAGIAPGYSTTISVDVTGGRCLPDRLNSLRTDLKNL